MGIANPAAMLRSTALMLEHGLSLPDDARTLEAAVEQALAGAPTPDLGGRATTSEFGDAVLRALS
jgi:isocitrate/isopropylmalate dehydrogenase